ncbi:MAG: efflux RND transporter periplasmic adaptor subunit [Zoogloeaceae bacterium]|jgi:membrane fusion protein (multidrug efflux system)|nr:efflux RND transporter periplasmic adaptor subunit [Zoogloeaceae bacterium]
MNATLQSKAASKRKGRYLALVLGGFFALAVVLWFLFYAGDAPSGAAADGKGKETPARVEVVTVRRVVFVEEASAVGSLKSNESVLLKPETSGRILEIHFKDGETARAGQLLFSLDAGIQEAELRQAKAQLALAQANHRRSEDLFQKKFISPQELDDTRATLKVREANVALAAARFSKTRIRAPFDGALGIRSVSPGDYVQEGAALARLEDIRLLKVDFRLPEALFSRLRPGLHLEVTTDVTPDTVFPAKLAVIDPLIDENGRSVACRALLDNREGRLRPGMFVRVRMVFSETSDSGASQGSLSLMIPEEAVISGAIPAVLRVESGIARHVPVRLGRRRAGQVEALEGLQEGDVIISAGHLKARDGAPVEPVFSESRAEAPS